MEKGLAILISIFIPITPLNRVIYIFKKAPEACSTQHTRALYLDPLKDAMAV